MARDELLNSSTSIDSISRDTASRVRRLVTQLRHGCGNLEQCHTPTCFTYRQRTSRVPLRQYNTLAATSIAIAFASSAPFSHSFCPLIKHDYPEKPWNLSPLDKIDHKSLVQRLHTTKAFRNFLNLEPLLHEDRVTANLLPDVITASNSQTPPQHGDPDGNVATSDSPANRGAFPSAANGQKCISATSPVPECVVANKPYISSLELQSIVRAWRSCIAAGDRTGLVQVVKYIKAIFSDPSRLGSCFDECFSRDIVDHAQCYSDYTLLTAQLHCCLHFIGPPLFQLVRNTLRKAIETKASANVSTRIMLISLFMMRYGGQDMQDLSAFTQIIPGESDLRSAHLLVEDMALSLADLFSAHLLDLAKQYNGGLDDPLVVSDLTDIKAHLMRSTQVYTNLLLRPWQILAQALVLREWDGKVQIRRQSAVGRALQALELLHAADYFGAAEWLSRDDHRLQQMRRRLDVEAACLSWLAARPPAGHRHILSYHALFSSHEQIEFFRTCCYLRMRQSYNLAEIKTMSRDKIWKLLKGEDRKYLERRMKLDLRHFLVLQISRENIMADAFNQLWQREQRELFRPLRIDLSKEDGEMGNDYGGVQVEIFNLLCNEICDPAMSIFEVNPQTQLAWFKPGSLEPLYRYELIGVLFGLAIFNGITLPLSLPLAFYIKLMGRKTDERHLEDGWPDLVKGFQQMRAYQGDVQNDLALEHVYTMSANGLSLDLDMTHHEWIQTVVNGMVKHHLEARVLAVRKEEHHAPSLDKQPQRPESTSSGLSSGVAPAATSDDPTTLSWPGWSFTASEEPTSPLPVSSSNLESYISLLTSWTLDLAVRPQFLSFARGFYRVIDPRSLGVLTPQSFKTLFEGSSNIDPADLRTAATYMGWEAFDPQLQWFWTIVESYDQPMLQRLLEFVTACKRMPGGKASRLTFVIAKQFDEHDRVEGAPAVLPRSSTCFGQLNLPEYQSLEVMRERLGVALEHSVGFGQA